MSGIWDYIMTGGHLYKRSFWREEYKRIAVEYEVTPDHVFAIAKGGPMMNDTDREIKDALRRAGVFSSLFE